MHEDPSKVSSKHNSSSTFTPPLEGSGSSSRNINKGFNSREAVAPTDRKGGEEDDKADLLDKGESGSQEDGGGSSSIRRVQQDSMLIIAEQILESPWFLGASLFAGAVAVAAVSAGVTIMVLRSSRR